MIEVLNSFWALEFEGTVLKVIWVSGPRQTDALQPTYLPNVRYVIRTYQTTEAGSAGELKCKIVVSDR